jgi:hypothetical protein
MKQSKLKGTFNYFFGMNEFFVSNYFQLKMNSPFFCFWWRVSLLLGLRREGLPAALQQINQS